MSASCVLGHALFSGFTRQPRRLPLIVLSSACRSREPSPIPLSTAPCHLRPPQLRLHDSRIVGPIICFTSQVVSALSGCALPVPRPYRPFCTHLLRQPDLSPPTRLCSRCPMSASWAPPTSPSPVRPRLLRRLRSGSESGPRSNLFKADIQSHPQRGDGHPTGQIRRRPHLAQPQATVPHRPTRPCPCLVHLASKQHRHH